MSPLDVFVSRVSYWRHVRPVWEALPAEARGTVWCAFDRAAETLGCYEARRGVPRGDGPPVLTAGGVDARQVPPQRLHFHMNHGAGQTYHGDPSHPTVDSASYVGGRDLDRVDVFLCVNEREAAIWSAVYPVARAVPIGTPALDALHAKPRRSEPPIVAVTFHWDCRMIAEAGTAWPEWRHSIADYARADPPVRLVGHEHPRWGGELLRWWRSIGVETMPDVDMLLSLADVVIADNTSVMFEAAALGIPVGVLNSERWRPEIEHGLRFWSTMPGDDYWPGVEFGEVVARTLEDGPRSKARRRIAVQQVWGSWLDGRAAERAVAEILPRLGE